MTIEEILKTAKNRPENNEEIISIPLDELGEYEMWPCYISKDNKLYIYNESDNTFYIHAFNVDRIYIM